MAGTLYVGLEAPHTYQRRFATPDIDAMLASSHLYLVTRAPAVRASIAEKVDEQSVAMTLTCRGCADRSVLIGPSELEPSLTLLGDGAYWVLTSAIDNARLVHGSAWAYAVAMHVPRLNHLPLREHQVLYVGKAYGRPTSLGGTTRNSSDRLAAHSTLQRIYEDHAGSDFDVFVTPLLMGERFFTNDDYIDDDEPGPLLDELEQVGLLQKTAAGEAVVVGITEEALVAYFKPEYNDLLKTWGQTTTTSAAAVMRTELRVLTVVLQAWEGLADFFSTSRPDPARAHLVRWALGWTEEAQPPYEPSRIFELLQQAAVSGLLQKVNESKRTLRVFGDALPRRSPWDEPLPDEGRLSS